MNRLNVEVMLMVGPQTCLNVGHDYLDTNLRKKWVYITYHVWFGHHVTSSHGVGRSWRRSAALRSCCPVPLPQSYLETHAVPSSQWCVSPYRSHTGRDPTKHKHHSIKSNVVSDVEKEKGKPISKLTLWSALSRCDVHHPKGSSSTPTS